MIGGPAWFLPGPLAARRDALDELSQAVLGRKMVKGQNEIVLIREAARLIERVSRTAIESRRMEQEALKKLKAIKELVT